jgi:tetratricopeptide (TPR) repeat protein
MLSRVAFFAGAFSSDSNLLQRDSMLSRQVLAGQPSTNPAARRLIRRHALAVLNDPDPGKARTALLIALEPVAHCDIVDLLADTLAEETIYRGFASILAEVAEDDPDADKRRFAKFNLARLHLAKAALLTGATARKALVKSAQRALDTNGSLDRDPAWVELQSEIAFLLGKVDESLAIATRLAALSGNPARAACRLGDLQRRSGRLDAAAATLAAALRKNSDGRLWKHRLLQRFAWVEWDRGRKEAAVEMLLESAKVDQDRDQPFPFETALARRMAGTADSARLARYAAAASAHLPGDPDAESLARLLARGNAR